MNLRLKLLAVAAGVVGMDLVDRGLSALWPAGYGLYHPLVAIAVLASMPLMVYLIARR